MSTATEAPPVGRKANKPDPEPTEPRRYGTLIRVSDEFAVAARELAALRGQTMAEMATESLLPLVVKLREDEMRRRLGGKK